MKILTHPYWLVSYQSYPLGHFVLGILSSALSISPEILGIVYVQETLWWQRRTYVVGAWCGHQTTALNKCHKSYTKSPAIYSSDLRELFLNLEDLEGERDYSVCCRLNLPTLLSIKLQNETKITKTALIFFS